ncbi:hypothetical protein F5X99DRAFT_412995 [Biscogniauxia marginata]|nr:hypothetical protein F5X99DRAFT_412995 [Biscogniauxia marginata]
MSALPRTGTRALLRHLRPSPILALGVGFGGGLVLGHARTRSRPLRMDARATPRPTTTTTTTTTTSATTSGAERSREGEGEGELGGGVLNAELMRQLSGGSVTGFVSGLLVSVFSRTLVLLLGFSIVIVQVASRYGINLVQQLRVKERVGKSRVLAALERDPAFKLSFGLFFAMSAFMQF